MFRKIFLAIPFFIFAVNFALAESDFDFIVGEVVEISGNSATFELLDGREISVEQNPEFASTENQVPVIGERFVLGRFEMGGEKIWQIYDRYRLAALLGIFALFVAILIFVGGWRGLTALAGLAVSVGGIIFGVVPALAAGYSPLAVALVGGTAIAAASIFIAHGFNFRSALAFFATIATLGIAAGLAVFFTNFAALFGTGSEESFYLAGALFENLDLRGLLLAGILLGALGVLDDITVAEVTTVDELQKANPNLSRGELFRRSLRVGREHIASMVNTLALAYAGVALPLILLFSVDGNQPLWALVNSEFAAEEIVRTLVGSLALILAAPISAGLGAFFLKKK
jgi:uncharacterized membrane protein